MEEKKKVKISLGTIIYITIIVVLVIALGIVYYLGFMKNNTNTKLEADNKELNRQINSLELEREKLNNKISEIEKEDNIIDYEKEQEIKKEEKVEVINVGEDAKELLNEIYEVLCKQENNQVEINSLTIYTNNVEKRKDIPEKFDNEKIIYRRA